MNPLNLIPTQFKVVAVLAAALAAFGAGWVTNGWRFGGQLASLQSEWDKERADQAEAELDLERETRRAVDAITVNSQKEKQRAKATIDSLRADVRNGTERLSVAVSSCATGDPRAGNPEARAELLPAVADRIVGIAADADDAVRELNECVDKYSAVKETR